ncbi:hypothetical protein [Myxococcus sp. AB056]|uniref:hypothetical protein n=1 Tax=Myxococcus sp. AB056 TaxID=2562792 RepID=UPI001E49630D|nr:hypothetical protein [Myxococcus sp. AB056]
MRAERPWGSGLGLALVVALLASGCASLPARPGQAGRGAVLAFSPLSVPAQAARSAAAGVYRGEEPGSAEGPSLPAPMGYRRGPFGSPVGEEGAGGENAEEGRAFVCGSEGVPEGWPHLDSSREVLELFLACASPAEFVAMQRGVDMPALVQSLTDWDAVRLGALGPMDAPASAVLSRKRAAFLVTSVEKYGVPYSEVLALFVLHAAFDDEVREVVQRLARDKQLGETLGNMPVVREEMKRRGLALEGFPERGEQARDVLRGMARAGRDMLSSSPASVEAQYSDLMAAKRSQLPPPYQDALDEVRKALSARHYAPGSVAAGAFDHLTFGVPVGFYHLVAGTGHGAYSLAQGKYEQATRELAPAALMVALYAGGKGARALVESNSGGRASLRKLAASEVEALKAVVKELEELFGPDAVRDVVAMFRGERKVAFIAATEGPAFVIALYEARGDVAKAQAALAVRSAEAAKVTPTKGVPERAPEATPARGAAPKSLREVPTKRSASKRRGSSGQFSQNAEISAAEAVKEKLRQAELEAADARLPKDVQLLRKLAPKLNEPPPGVKQGASLWRDYVAYRKNRLKEIRDGEPVKGPLVWEGYQAMRDRYARGMAFERKMVALLEEDAAKPQVERTWLKDFDEPHIETHVGVAKVDFRYADVLVIEGRPTPGQPPRVETFSFKSRDLRFLKSQEVEVRVNTDASNAMKYYGGSLRILREGMRQQADVRRVRLIYEGPELLPKETKLFTDAARTAERKIKGVEVEHQ